MSWCQPIGLRVHHTAARPLVGRVKPSQLKLLQHREKSWWNVTSSPEAAGRRSTPKCSSHCEFAKLAAWLPRGSACSSASSAENCSEVASALTPEEIL
ncbi:hypothetical protein EYF80_051031 [Liparis tanakae]|uniref:Uncharacterized protein n=1 Tax=Liparis tanakae TaxID=230148 RepID=A0A4Z2FD46_9TELE|nr:hypothetical protein EYF80_051031 [Liparis tanakae]